MCEMGRNFLVLVINICCSENGYDLGVMFKVIDWVDRINSITDDIHHPTYFP